MGWHVISKCYLSFEPEYSEEIKEFIKAKGSFYYDEDFSKAGEFYLEISGNKDVDYTELEALRDYCIKKKISIKINCNEYSEGDGGFYYDSEEVE